MTATQTQAAALQVSLTNFGTLFSDRFSTFEDAVAFAKAKGFEAAIHQDGRVIGTWHPIYGARHSR